MRHVFRTVLIALLAGGILAGCATNSGRYGSGGPRSITLHHPESRETVSVTYNKGGGRYDPAAMDAVARLFRDRHRGEIAPIDPELLDLLTDVRDRLGLPPDTAIHLTSGYRSPVTNASLSRTNRNVAENSYHIRGMAADIRIPGVEPERIVAVAAGLGRGGYALYPHSGHVHIDTGPHRTWGVSAPRPDRGKGWTDVKATTRSRTSVAALKAVPPKPPSAKAAPVTVAAAKPAAAKPASAKTAPAAAGRPSRKPGAGVQTVVELPTPPRPPRARN